MKKIKVMSYDGEFVKYLNVQKQIERYNSMFRIPPTADEVVELMNTLGSYYVYKLVNVSDKQK